MTVYFIKAGDFVAIKIGYTSGNPVDRMAYLQVGCPLKLELIGAVDGSPAHESGLHRELSEHKTIGEWFNPHADVLAAVEKALTYGPPAPPATLIKRPKHQNAACEIIDLLGGNQAVAKLTKSKPSAVSMWRKHGQFPANTFTIFEKALSKHDLAPSPALWGMTGKFSAQTMVAA